MLCVCEMLEEGAAWAGDRLTPHWKACQVLAIHSTHCHLSLFTYQVKVITLQLFSAYIHPLVCVYVYVNDLTVLLSQISVKAHVFDLNQLMGVNTNQCLGPETECSCPLCSFTCAYSPFFVCLQIHILSCVWLITF